jgi:hypothetical protein
MKKDVASIQRTRIALKRNGKSLKKWVRQFAGV